MIRRGFMTGLLALALASCASGNGGTAQAPRESAVGFSSDRITITTQGRGPDVILIPGLTSSPEIRDTTAAALNDAHRVHLVQVNGFAGVAAAGNAEGAVSAPVAEEIARYIREQGLERPAVIGHSMGGTIGMMLTARHPDQVGADGGGYDPHGRERAARMRPRRRPGGRADPRRDGGRPQSIVSRRRADTQRHGAHRSARPRLISTRAAA